MDGNTFALIAGALLGSSGIAGVASGQLQLGRASRLRKLVRESKEIVDAAGSDTPIGRVAKEALNVAVAEHAAILIVRRSPTRVRRRIASVGATLVICGIVGLFVNWLIPPIDEKFFGHLSPLTTVIHIVYFFGGYAMCLFALLDYSTLKKRELFVQEALKGEHSAIRLREMHLWLSHDLEYPVSVGSPLKSRLDDLERELDEDSPFKSPR